MLTSAALWQAFEPQSFVMREGMAAGRYGGVPGGGPLWSNPTQSMWADMLAASGAGSSSQIPPDQIRSILREALIGGGAEPAAAIDTAERIHRNQLNRAVDFLAADIVRAAVAAG